MSYMGQVSGRAMQSGDIGTDAVITAKIADLNVTSAKVATGIDAVKLADGTATTTGPGGAGTLLTSAGAGAPPTFESSDAAAMALALG